MDNSTEPDEFAVNEKAASTKRLRFRACGLTSLHAKIVRP